MWALALAKGAWGFLRGIPWQAWGIAAILGVGWYYGHVQYEAGVAAENTRWTTAQVEADRQAQEAIDARDKAAETVNSVTDERGHKATVETRTETAAAVERVNHEMQRAAVPADCPGTLPERVQQEGRAAVDRARAAGDSLRTGRDAAGP